MEENKKMSKNEKIIWTIISCILLISTFIIENWNDMGFLKLPSYILDGAGLLSLLIRNIQLKWKKEESKQC